MKKYLRWLLVLFGLLVVGSVAAAELVQQDVYLLPEGEVVEGDLYIVAGDNVTIDGVVKGDLIALSVNVEINGRVEGDLLAAALGVQIAGEVDDDVRLAAGSVTIDGQIHGDLAATGSGGASFTPAPLVLASRTYDLGLFINEDAVIDGDIVLGGGLLRLAGVVNGRLLGTVGMLDLATATINGGTDVAILGDVRADEESVVLGSGFNYAAINPLNVNSKLSEEITYTPVEVDDSFDWVTALRQITGRLVIFAVLGWLLLRFAPQSVFLSVAALNTRMSRNLWLSIFTLIGVPLGTFAVASVFAFFLSLGPLVALIGFIVFAYALLLSFSPLLVGLWLGQWFSDQAYTGLMIGMTILVVLSQLPNGVGIIVSMMSATIALAGLIGRFYVGLPIEDEPTQTE